MQPTEAQMKEARAWLSDAEIASRQWVANMTDCEAETMVSMYYDGGWRTFLADTAALAA